MTQDSVQTSLGRMAYRLYSSPKASRTLLCIHGYDRTGRDFARLAGYLSPRYNVLCPDLFGRGRSEWLTDKLQYHPATYAEALSELLQQLGIRRFDCLGTSVGGHVALLLSTLESGIQSMIINDIGPRSEVASFRALARSFRARRYEFASLEDAQAYLRTLNAPFGLTSDEEWRLCAMSCLRERGDGGYFGDYDPDLPVVQESPSLAARDLWAQWEALRCPTLLLRGETSRVLSREVAARMVAFRPNVTLAEMAGCGHAPMLYGAEQMSLVGRWLDAQGAPTVVGDFAVT